jgi:hypothetical protein
MAPSECDLADRETSGEGKTDAGAVPQSPTTETKMFVDLLTRRFFQPDPGMSVRNSTGSWRRG